jgi:dihydrofolate reductase
MKLSVIVAVAENGIVGRDNALPWHLPADLKYFKKMTLGKPIVMGRKTFESIGRPLPGRTNIVISRNPDFVAQGVHVCASVQDALAVAADVSSRDGGNELMVIGGAAIYSATIPLAECLYITEVHAEVEGDAKLPVIEWGQWQEQSRQRHCASEAGGLDFSFVVYRRREE